MAFLFSEAALHRLQRAQASLVNVGELIRVGHTRPSDSFVHLSSSPFSSSSFSSSSASPSTTTTNNSLDLIQAEANHQPTHTINLTTFRDLLHLVLGRVLVSALRYSVFPSIHTSLHPSYHPSVCPSIRLPIHPSNHRSFTAMLIHPFRHRGVRICLLSCCLSLLLSVSCPFLVPPSMPCELIP